MYVPATAGQKETMHKSCTICGGDCSLLGQLGSLRHWRCRCCGLDQSTRVRRRDQRCTAKAKAKERTVSLRTARSLKEAF